ncbi:MAG: GNA1162 family protein [Endomicrobiia bacterium]
MQKDLKNYKTIIVVLSGLLLFGCVAKPKFIIDNYSPPMTVAVLPFNNFTTDLDGPVYVRKVFSEGIRCRGYIVKSINETDEILRGIGITDGGQLPAFKPEKIGEALKVDALFYGDLLEFNYITLGFYNKKSVAVNLKLLDSKTGKILWEDEKKVSRTELALSSEEALKKFKNKMIEKTIEKTFRVPLKEEVEEVVRKIILTLPRR